MAKMITILLQVNISNIQWTPTEDLYMMELISGIENIKDLSHLSSFRLFDHNVDGISIFNILF